MSSLPATVSAQGTECHPANLDPACCSGHTSHRAALLGKILILLGKVQGADSLYQTIFSVKRSQNHRNIEPLMLEKTPEIIKSYFQPDIISEDEFLRKF